MRVACRAGGSDRSPSKGFGMLEWFGGGGPVSQGSVVKSAKFVYNQLWRAMTQELAPQDSGGSYARPRDPFVLEGALEGAGNPARAFYLYTGNACPWCHRCLLAIALLGVGDRVKVVDLADDAERASRGGWILAEGARDPLFGARDLREVYDGAAGRGGEGFRGRCTAPLLVDGQTKRVVSNNSTNIMRLLNQVALAKGGSSGAGAVDLFPRDQAQEIEAMADRLFSSVNNAV